MDLNLPLVLDGASGQLHVLRSARQKLSSVGLAGDEDHSGRRHVPVGAHLRDRVYVDVVISQVMHA